jgi:hypothetical protein
MKCVAEYHSGARCLLTPSSGHGARSSVPAGVYTRRVSDLYLSEITTRSSSTNGTVRAKWETRS